MWLSAAGAKIDPRAALTGRLTGDGWQSGLMDHGSWVEMQRDWARTVIVGRARLGGCPVGERRSPACAFGCITSSHVDLEGLLPLACKSTLVGQICILFVIELTLILLPEGKEGARKGGGGRMVGRCCWPFCTGTCLHGMLTT